MTEKDFWRNAKVAIIGSGSFGTALASIVAKNCMETRMWTRFDDQARQINATRVNAQYLPELTLPSSVKAYSDLDRIFDGGVSAVIWALPSKACREVAQELAPRFHGDEILLHAVKGIEQGTLKRISEVLLEEIPCPRVGVISGPNLAHEIAHGLPAATTVASNYDEVISAGAMLLSTERFRVYGDHDVVGVEWAGTLKNILAIASGTIDALNLGWNARAMLITRGLAEMVRFGSAMGARLETFLGLAGVGDLLATASSNLSRNYRVGYRLAKGEKLEAVLADLGTTAEGVTTTRIVWDFANRHGITMPITEAVHHLLDEQMPAQEIVHALMTTPIIGSLL